MSGELDRRITYRLAGDASGLRAAILAAERDIGRSGQELARTFRTIGNSASENLGRTRQDLDGTARGMRGAGSTLASAMAGIGRSAKEHLGPARESLGDFQAGFKGLAREAQETDGLLTRSFGTLGFNAGKALRRGITGAALGATRSIAFGALAGGVTGLAGGPLGAILGLAGGAAAGAVAAPGAAVGGAAFGVAAGATLDVATGSAKALAITLGSVLGTAIEGVRSGFEALGVGAGQAFGEAEADMASFVGRAKETEGTLGGLVGLARDLGVSLTRSGLQRIASTGRLAESLDIDTRAASRLRGALEVLGGSGIEDGLLAMGRALREADDETSDAARSLRALGVESRDPVTAMLELADALSQTADGEDRTRAASTLLGEAHATLVPILEQGSGRIRDAMVQIRREGLETGQATTDTIDRIRENFRSLLQTPNPLTAYWLGLSDTLTKKVLPVLDDLSTTAAQSTKFFGAGGGALLTLIRANDLFLRGVQPIHGTGSPQRSKRRVEIESEEETQAQTDRERREQETLQSLWQELGLLKAQSAEMELQVELTNGRYRDFDTKIQKEIELLSAWIERAKEEKARNDEARRATEDLEKRLASVGIEGEAARVKFELTRGTLAHLTDEQKRRIETLAVQLDQAEAENQRALKAKELKEAAAEEIKTLRAEIEILQAVGEERKRQIEFAQSRFAQVDAGTRREILALREKKSVLEQEAEARKSAEEVAAQVRGQLVTLDEREAGALNRLADLRVSQLLSHEEYQEAIRRTKEEFQELRRHGEEGFLTMEILGTEALGGLGDAFAQYLGDPAKQSFREILSGWLGMVQRMAASGLIQQLGRFLFPSAGGRGPKGGGGFLNILGGFAGGGLIGGVGTATSDSNLIAASRGEYMVQASGVARAGVGFMDAVNRGDLAEAWEHLAPSFPAVDVRQAVQGIPAIGAPEVSVPIKVLNIQDPREIDRYLESGQGDRTILNLMLRNKDVLEALFGGR